MGQDGTVTIDPEPSNADEQKMASALGLTGRWLVMPIVTITLAEAARKMLVAAQDPTKKRPMVAAFAEVSDEVSLLAGAVETSDDSAGTAPQYKGLPEAAEACAQGTTEYKVETNNSHVDPAKLSQGGETLDILLALDQVHTQASTHIGLTTAPLARQLSGWVNAVLASVQSELTRNPGLERVLMLAIRYGAERVAKGQATKKKVKAAKADATKEAQAAVQKTAAAAPASGQGGSKPSLE